MAFLLSHLFPGETAVKKFQRLGLDNFDKLTVTATGQVSTSLKSLSVEAMARRGATKLMPNPQVVSNRDSLLQLQTKVQADVRQLAGVAADEKQIVGMRVEDVVRVMNWICTRNDVDQTQISLYGKGGLGMVALHAAAIDRRVGRVLLENSLVSYRMALEAGLHKNLSELVIPSGLTRYDTPQLMQAIFPRPIFLINPANAMGQELRSHVAKEALSTAFSTDSALGKPDRIKLIHRGFGDPLPFE